jgi:MoaA/NifB/PqqE/SkfB family radical SAM enzyme
VDKKPVVVWNGTRRCNLHCMHCYAEATTEASPGELSTEEAVRLIDDIAAFGSPTMLFSTPLAAVSAASCQRTGR